MIISVISVAVEGALLLALSWGSVYTLRASGVFPTVVEWFNYYYPLTFTQVFILLIVLVCLIGIFLVFALGTKGIRWFIAPILALCLPSLISHSGLPTYLKEQYTISLDFPIFKSDLTPTGMLAMALALVAGFVVLHQMISLREMSDHLGWRGVEDKDIANVYRGRSIAIIIIVFISVVASYFVSHYSSEIKGIFSESLNLTPLLYLLVGVVGGLVTIAIILILLGAQKPKTAVAPERQPRSFYQRATGEAKAVVNMFVPSALTGKIGRLMTLALRPLIKAGRSGARRIMPSRRFGFLKRSDKKSEE